MKKYIPYFLIACVLIATSCRKEQPPTCYICQWRVYNTSYAETKCGEKPADYFTDSLGNTIVMDCKKK